MRILHVIASVNPSIGGPIEGIRQRLVPLKQWGHTVEIACLDAPGSPWLQGGELSVFALGPGFLKYGYSPRLIPWLRANAGKYDAVVVSGIWQFHSYATWRALHAKDIPYFVFPHGMLDPWFKRTYPLKHLKKWGYWPWAEYRVLRDAKAVLFTCEEEMLLARQSFPSLYKVREVVAGYGISGPAPAKAKQLQAFYDICPQLRGEKFLLFLSRLHVKKGCDLLLKAFASICGTTQSLKLVMAGPDQTGWQPDLLALVDKLGIADRVIWPGLLQGDAKWGAFQAASAFVLPSHQENFGIVVAEAMACKLPILISDQVNIWRELARTDAALVEKDTLEGTCRLLQRWLSMNEQDCTEMALRAHACFLDHFTVEQSAQRFVDIIGHGGGTPLLT